MLYKYYSYNICMIFNCKITTNMQITIQQMKIVFFIYEISKWILSEDELNIAVYIYIKKS